ncbi:MAG: YbaK/EbsC family protein [Anaerolineae bacterium]|nr:MAG: YbaK/EbsC family protein [Anaerolineae bacterium]
MTHTSPAAHVLTAQGIPFREFTHLGQVSSLEQAAAERDQTPGQVVRSILFRLGEEDYALVLVAGPQQVNWKALRRHFNQSRLTMASPEEVLSVTGFEIGAVGPFGLKRALPIVLDASLTAQSEVSLGSGVRGTAVILTVADLQAALGQPPIAALTQSSF